MNTSREAPLDLARGIAERVGAEHQVLAHRHVGEQAASFLHHDDAARRELMRRKPLTSSPLNSTLPLRAISRVMARSSVVLPAPFGPSTVTSSPSATVRLTGLSAATRP